MTTQNPLFRDCFAPRCSASAWAPGWSPTTSGSRPGRLGRQGGPDELALRAPRTPPSSPSPTSATIMTSELRQKLRRVLPMQENGQRELREPDRHQHRNRHRPRRRLPVARSSSADQGRRHGPRARPVRRGEDRSADARARRARSRTYKGKRLVVADHARGLDDDAGSAADTGVATRSPPTALPCRSWSPASSPSAAPRSSGPPSTCITPATIRRRASKASPATKS